MIEFDHRLDDLSRCGGTDRDIGHDSDEPMFLDIEVSVWVQDAQWHPFGPGTAYWKREQLGD
jgi:hypothetical protein